MSQVFRRYRDVDIVSTTNPGSTLADVIENVQENQQSSMKYFQPLSGVLDGVNKVFTLPETPDEGTVLLYMGGQLQHPGLGNDYEISEDTITFVDAPSVASVLWANYQLTIAV